MIKPVISVCITTYFHEKYIGQAIESVINQKISVPYEICISDDCSLDKTVEILRDYATRHDFIKINVNKRNEGLTRNMFTVREMARGDFLVMLSGDDYYIDDLKLKKQFDFLTNNPDFFGVATTIESRYDDSDKTVSMFPPRRIRNSEVTLEDFLSGRNFPLSGIMYRNVLKEQKYYDLLSMMPKISSYIDDVTDSIFLLQIGRIFVLKDSCTAYRIRKNNSSDKNFNSINKGLSSYFKHIEMLNNLDSFYSGKLDLYYRYKDILSAFWIKSFVVKQHNEYLLKSKTIPLRYRKKHLYFHASVRAFLSIPIKLFKKIWRL